MAHVWRQVQWNEGSGREACIFLLLFFGGGVCFWGGQYFFEAGLSLSPVAAELLEEDRVVVERVDVVGLGAARAHVRSHAEHQSSLKPALGQRRRQRGARATEARCAASHF